MKSLYKNIRIRPFVNHAIEEEERIGEGTELMQSYRTYELNPEVRQRIQKMSVLEIIS